MNNANRRVEVLEQTLDEVLGLKATDGLWGAIPLVEETVSMDRGLLLPNVSGAADGRARRREVRIGRG